MNIIFLFIGLIIGFAIGYYYVKSTFRTYIDHLTLKNEYIGTDMYQELKSRYNAMEEKYAVRENEIIELNKAIASQEQLIDTLREQAACQDLESEKLQERMKSDFELLSSRLLEEKGNKMMKQSQEQIGMLLNPLKEKLLEFERKVEHYYVDDNRQRAAVLEQIKNLTELNKLVTDETKNLTRALKGDSKVQGNWGEMILERILNFQGLQKVENILYNSPFKPKTEEGCSPICSYVCR
jgi:DNA recombination protein RmuC